MKTLKLKSPLIMKKIDILLIIPVSIGLTSLFFFYRYVWFGIPVDISKQVVLFMGTLVGFLFIIPTIISRDL